MKICAIVGSSMAGGNTDSLTDAFLRGAAEYGHTAVKFCLGQTHVEPCLGCNACREKHICVQKDDFSQIVAAFTDCDIVVLATPIYFWGMSAQLKAVIDRMYSLGEKDPRGYFKYPYKHCVLLATAADTDRHFWVFESLIQYYERLTNYLRWTSFGILAVGSCGGTVVPRRIGETSNIEKGYEFGKQIGRRMAEEIERQP